MSKIVPFFMFLRQAFFGVLLIPLAACQTTTVGANYQAQPKTFSEMPVFVSEEQSVSLSPSQDRCAMEEAHLQILRQSGANETLRVENSCSRPVRYVYCAMSGAPFTCPKGYSVGDINQANPTKLNQLGAGFSIFTLQPNQSREIQKFSLLIDGPLSFFQLSAFWADIEYR